MTVRMWPVEEPQERPFRNRGRDVLQLTQSIDAQAADALAVLVTQTGANQQIGEQRGTATNEPFQRAQRKRRDIRPDVDVVLRANSGDGVRYVDRAERTRPLVHHVRRDGRQSFLTVGISARAPL